jgi:ABC-type polysaccharide/polyol phosphate export permease
MFKERVIKMYLSRRVLWDMAVKQFRGKYSGSRLGIGWAVITPLILAFSIHFVFIGVFKVKVDNYFFLVISGILPWMFFANAVSEAVNSFTANSQVLKQNIFPREFVPVASTVAEFLSFLIGIGIIIPFFVVLKSKVLFVMAGILIPLLLQLIFVSGAALLLACVNVFTKDLSHLLPSCLMIWFWITPVFYTVEMLPDNLQWVSRLNPMTYYIAQYQDILFKAKMPGLQDVLIALCISLLVLCAGLAFFINTEAKLLKRI